MSDFIPKIDLVIAKGFNPKTECVICGKKGDTSELTSQQHGRDKIKQVNFSAHSSEISRNSMIH